MAVRIGNRPWKVDSNFGELLSFRLLRRQSDAGFRPNPTRPEAKGYMVDAVANDPAFPACRQCDAAVAGIEVRKLPGCQASRRERVQQPPPIGSVRISPA